MSLVRTHRIRQGIFTMYLKRMNFPGGGVTQIMFALHFYTT